MLKTGLLVNVALGRPLTGFGLGMSSWASGHKWTVAGAGCLIRSGDAAPGHGAQKRPNIVEGP